MKLKGKEYILFLYISFIIILILSFKIGIMYSIFAYLILFMLWFIYALFKIYKNNKFNIYFGVPGSGKSTFATHVAIITNQINKKIQKKNKHNKIQKKVYTCNLSVKGATPIEKKDINDSNEDLKNCVLLIDESGLSYNNRNFSKNFTESELKLFKYHRKRNIDIYIFSQSYKDMDLKLRDLATQFYFLHKSLIPFFIKTTRIKKYITIVKDANGNSDIGEGYKKVLFGGFYVYMPKTWKYFDTTEEH